MKIKQVTGLLVAFLGLNFLFLNASKAPVGLPGSDLEYAKGRILVEARPGLSPEALDKILSVHGGKGKKIGQSNLHVVELPKGVSEKDVVDRLSKNPHLKSAELDFKLRASFTPNDSYLGNEWHINKVGAPLAWDTTQGAGITIAILDSGVDSTHPDLVSNLVPGFNTYDNNTNTADVCGHGTAVAGTAAATSNNLTGVAGVAGQARIMPIRIAYFDTTANSCYGYFSTMTSGVTYAADHGARIANISYGGVPSSSTIQSAANYMKSKGGLVFVSAGNNGIDEGYAPTTSMIIVSATDEVDNKTSWSSFGNFVSLAAPGANIWTTSKGGGYNGWNGTSFSAPLTAGIGALVMSARPDLSSSQVESILFSTAVDIGAAGRDPLYGYGRVDAAAAIQAARAFAAPTDSQAPSVSISSPGSNSTVSGLVSINVSASDNVGVTQVELSVNGTVIAVDNSSPFGFSWDSNNVANGSATLVATAYDAAGNKKSSTPVSINVSNGVVQPPVTDTTAPTVSIASPVGGSISGSVTVSVYASDNSGAAGISLAISVDGVVKAQGTGGSLSYSLNARKLSSGSHTIKAVATDAAGNSSSASVVVTK